MRDFFCTQKDLLLPEEGGREENGSMRYFCYIGYQTKTVDNQTRLVGLCIQKWNLRGEKIAESCLTPLTNPSSFFLSLRKASSEPDVVLLSYNGKILNAILHLEAKLASYPFEGLETFDVNEFQGITYGFVEMDIRDAWWRVFHEKKQDVDATSMAFMAKKLFEYACDYGQAVPSEVLNDPYFDNCRCLPRERDYHVGGVYEESLIHRLVHHSSLEEVDQLLFFDIECSNCDRGEGKICEFSYCITDLNGNILKEEEILVNPGVGEEFEFKLLRPGDELHLKYEANDYWAYRQAPSFGQVLPKIESLLLDSHTLAAGYAVLNDLRFLDYSFNRYGKRLELRGAFDVQKLYTPIAHRQIKLEKAYEMFSNGTPYDDGLTPHSSLDDAKMSAKSFFFYCKAKNIDAKTLLMKSRESFVFLLDSFYENVDARDLSAQYKFRRDYSLYVQDCRAYLKDLFQSRCRQLFCDATYLERYANEGMGKRVFFTSAVQEKGQEAADMVDELIKKGYFVARKPIDADYCIHDEYEDPDRLSASLRTEATMIVSLKELPN